MSQSQKQGAAEVTLQKANQMAREWHPDDPEALRLLLAWQQTEYDLQKLPDLASHLTGSLLNQAANAAMNAYFNHKRLRILGSTR